MMKRFGLIVMGSLLAGCATEQTAPQHAESCKACAATSAPAVTEVTTPTAPAVAAPAAPAVVATPAVAAPATPQPVFELSQEGKVYVFPSVDAMTDFTNGKQLPTLVEKPNFTPSGKTVVFEAADAAQAEQMLASYNKLHPVAK